MGKGRPKPTSSGSERPLGVARQNRQAEKVELQLLNDRLACYIDRVRYLETENDRLNRELNTIVATNTKEKAEIRQMFEDELADARKALDEVASEKAKLEIDVKRLLEDNGELDCCLKKKITELNAAQQIEQCYNELQGKYNSMTMENTKAAKENEELKNEVNKFKGALNDLRGHLEGETLGRVEAENTIQSLREELTFKESLYDKEISHLRKLNEDHSSDKFEAHLQKSLRELREEYETEMNRYREQTDNLHANNVKELENELARANESAAVNLQDATACRNQIYPLHEKISELEGQAAAHSERVVDLESTLDNQIRLRDEDEKELVRLRHDLDEQLKAYQDLMDVKVSLDLEINAYDKLLSSEEERLNLNC